MKNTGLTALVAAAAVFLTIPGFGQSERDGQGQAIVTILPKHEGDKVTAPASGDLKLKVNGKQATVQNWTALSGPQNGLELVVLIDGSSRTSLGRQLDDIAQFVKAQPVNTKIAIAYMSQGNAEFTGPFTTDHDAALRGLHLPGGSAGSSASPYFCISDLAKRWPSQDRAARREVLAITDGVDNYERRYDPDDPYVQAAISDSLRAGIVVYSIYWRDQGRANNTQYENNAGQNLMLAVTQATGGKSFWEGLGNPVSFQPYLEELTRRFRNQYELSFTVALKGKSEVETMKLKFSAPGAEITSPEQVFVVKAGVAQN